MKDNQFNGTAGEKGMAGGKPQKGQPEPNESRNMAEKASDSTTSSDQNTEKETESDNGAEASGPGAADFSGDNADADPETGTVSEDGGENTQGEAADGEEGGDGETDDDTVDPLEKKLAEKELMMAELQDRYLRLTAEYDNYRKRTLKEKLELQQTSREEVILSILSVVDDFERAMGSIEHAKDLEAVKEGIHLIHGKFKNYLTQQGVKEIDANNKPFDTDLHEAVTKIPVKEKKKKGKVVDVIEKGYMLKDRVIRFSKVVIGE